VTNTPGFSLVEVVVAIGVAAVAVVSVVALYRPIVMAVSDVRTLDEAAQIVRKIEDQWARLDFDEKEAAIDNGTRFFASRGGTLVAPEGDPAWVAYGVTDTERDAAKVYEGVFLRDTALSPATETFPASIHVTLHLAWPAHRSDGTRVTESASQQHRFTPMVFNR
jgi:uncharacterized protein (TIGR02598 family)